MNLEQQVGLSEEGNVVVPDRRSTTRLIMLKIAAMGCQIPGNNGDQELLHLARDLFARYREQSRLLSQHLCPVDQRIQDFLDAQFAPLGLKEPVRLPSATPTLDRYALARELSLPMHGDACQTDAPPTSPTDT